MNWRQKKVITHYQLILLNFLTMLQTKKTLICSSYKELKEFGLKFEIKKTGHTGSYTVMLKEENDKLYFEKELIFNKDKLLENLIKENHNKNVVFKKYQGKIYPLELEITKPFFKKNEGQR